jgi:integrase
LTIAKTLHALGFLVAAMPAIRFPAFTEEVLTVYRVTARPATVCKMAQVLREVGELKAVRTTADLTPLRLADWLNSMRDRKPATIAGLVSYFRAACNYARARGYLRNTPFEARQSWGQLQADDDEEPRRHHGLAELELVRAHLESHSSASWEGHRLYALFCLVAFTGLRKNEALHAQVRDLDLDQGVIRLVKRRRHGLKTRAAAQPVPVPDAALAVLAGWVPRTGSLWLFPGKRGACPWVNGMPGKKPLDCLKAAGKAAGVEGLTFQSLRHSWATHAESAWGFSELLVQRVLRHTRRTTQLHYRHADLANLRAQVRAVDFAALKSPQPPHSEVI